MFSCQACGYSKFYYANEFADGDPQDFRRLCSDCGTIECYNDLEDATDKAVELLQALFSKATKGQKADINAVCDRLIASIDY